MKKFLIIFLIGMFFLGFCLLNVFGINIRFLQAQESSNEGGQNIDITLVGVIKGAGAPNYLSGTNDVYVSGNYAYVSSYNDGSLTIINISNPSKPAIKGFIKGFGAPNYLDGVWGVKVVGSYAYVCSANDHALSIIDISDPSNPALKGVVKGAGSPNYLSGAADVFVRNNYV